MIARGQHIKPINEMYAIRKSDGGYIFDTQDVPYCAASGPNNMEEIRKAMGESTRWIPSIDEEIAKRQERKP